MCLEFHGCTTVFSFPWNYDRCPAFHGSMADVMDEWQEMYGADFVQQDSNLQDKTAFALNTHKYFIS